jgi:DNA-directed RNA polymerase subunit K
MLVPGVMLMLWPKDRLTRFEVARVIGARALQIALGAPILVKVEQEGFDPTAIAEEELKECKIPMTIKRTLPSGDVIVVDIKPSIKNWLDDHHGKI